MGVTSYNTQSTGGSVQAGRGPLNTWLAALAVIGSMIAVNFVGKNQTSSFVVQDRAALTSPEALDTNTGGLVKYRTIRLQSPYRSGSTAWGLPTGTGVTKFAKLELIRNPMNASLDCTLEAAGSTGSGGRVLFNNVSGTGTIALSNSGLTMGPTQEIVCSTLTTITGSFSGSLVVDMASSRVTN